MIRAGNPWSFLGSLRSDAGLSPGRMVLTSSVGLVAGLANVGLLAIINSSLHAPRPQPALIWGFVALALVQPVGRLSAVALIVQLAERAQLDLRMKLSRRILATPLSKLEELGPHRLLATLTDDVGSVGRALATIPTTLVNLSVIAGCLLYLGWLSWLALACVAGVIVVGVVTYRLVADRGVRYYRRSRERLDALFGHFRDLIEGIKELQLHQRRQDGFVSGVLEPTAEAYRSDSIRGSLTYHASNSLGQMLFFVAVGLLLFVLPRFADLPGEVLTGYVLVLLYMMAPLQNILQSLPTLARAGVALERTEHYRRELAAGEASPRPVDPRPPWKALELEEVTYTYGSGNGTPDTFTLGPVSLALTRGELLFLTGGNGSGKTTLAKLLVGLYAPDSGSIRLGGRPVEPGGLVQYRQHFSAVFQDFHLFGGLLGIGPEDGPEGEADRLLRDLRIETKVRLEDGGFSTLALSKGQRKRLALLTAFLEDRPFYVFDEWAAEQDPVFKELFYTVLLERLKQRGKTVVVISHDDRYYGLADRVVKLTNGRIEAETGEGVGGWVGLHEAEREAPGA